MVDERLQERIDAYSFFVDTFMALPDERFVEGVLDRDFCAWLDSEEDLAGAAFARFQEANRGKDVREVLEAISVDRTQLLRGVREGSVQPPYESLYVSAKPEDSCLSVAAAYRAAGLSVSPDAKEPPEYIGCELGFMLELCRRQEAAREEGDADAAERFLQAQANFFGAHLGRWAEVYAKEMIAAAETDLYRGIGQLLADFMAEERVLLLG